MNSYAQHLAEHGRLCILRSLAESAGYASNSAVLASVLPAFGLDLSRDAITVHLAWLAEQGLVSTNVMGSVTTAKLSTRGLDVAAGRASVPGVARPSPGG